MRLALISDLHANEIALDAVLEDARRVGYDQLVCLGDVPTLGPRPDVVLERLRAIGCACILGNHDEFMLDPALVRSYSESPLIVASVDATREALSAEAIAFIRTFERTLVLDVEGGSGRGGRSNVFLYHGTPRSNMEDLLAITPAERVDEMLDGKRALVLAGGHTHIQMLRQHHGMLIVNPGSIGMPIRDYASGGPPVILSHAEYAIVDLHANPRNGNGHVDVGVQLRRVSLDQRALASQIDGWDNPLAAPLRASYA
jgi:predicted phosphodiesterase